MFICAKGITATSTPLQKTRVFNTGVPADIAPPTPADNTVAGVPADNTVTVVPADIAPPTPGDNTVVGVRADNTVAVDADSLYNGCLNVDIDHLLSICMPCDIDETCNPLLLVPLQSTPLPDVTAIGMQTVDTVSTESSVVAQTPVVGRRVTKIARRRVTASTVVTRARARSDPRSSVRNPKRQSVNRTVPENESYVHPIPSASEDSLLSGSDDNDECTVYNLARQKATRSRAQSVVNAEPSKMRLNWKDGGMSQEHWTGCS